MASARRTSDADHRARRRARLVAAARHRGLRFARARAGRRGLSLTPVATAAPRFRSVDVAARADQAPAQILRRGVHSADVLARADDARRPIERRAPRGGASRARRRRVLEMSLLGLSCVVVVAGAFVLLLATAQERRLNAVRGEFVANVSHELKTPLSLVRMFGELLMTERVASDDKRKQYLSIIVRERRR